MKSRPSSAAEPTIHPVAPSLQNSQKQGTLYYGDNLSVLRDHVGDASVDLIYLDPPFNSQRNYNVLYKERDASESEAQVRAFEDCWRWDTAAEATYRALVNPGSANRLVSPDLGTLLEGLRVVLGPRDMMAYLVMMSARLVELRRVLKPTGSIYLHCDPTASHYLKIILDVVFGPGCFRNEVIWRYRRWPTTSRQFQKMHDVLLFYSRSPNAEHVFHTLYGYEKLADSTLKTFGNKKQRADFSSGHRKPSTVEEETQGPPLSDVWEVGVIAPISKERLGYPTQKPEALLERVIRASSNEGDVVLDPFCGCGTAISVAQRYGRRWIGIDITHVAIEVIRERLNTSFPNVPSFYDIFGEPADVAGALALAEANKHEFQAWAVHRLGGRLLGEVGTPKVAKKGMDRGIDGVIRFLDDPRAEKSQRIIVSVKAGQTVNPAMVRELRGTIEREGAPIGVLVTVQEPTREMLREAASAGTWSSSTFDTGRAFDRIQILTVDDLLRGAKVLYPGENRTLKSSPPAAPVGVQIALPLGEAPPKTQRPGVRKASVPESPVQQRRGRSG